MRRLLIWTTFVLLVAPSAASPAPALRAMSWNIAGGPVNGRLAAQLPFDLAAIEAVITRNAPDVLGVQEACSWQSNALATDLGYVAWHETTVAGLTDPRPPAAGRCDFGDALLVRGSATLEQRLRSDLLGTGSCKGDATQSGLPECRVLQTALLSPAGVRVANTHVGIDATAPAQLGRIGDGAAALSGPAVLLGDDNVQPQVPGLVPRLGRAGFQDAAGALPGLACADVSGCAQSLPAGGAFGQPRLRADYVWYRGLRGTGAVADVMVGGAPASDHLAVVASLRVSSAVGGGLAVRPRSLRGFIARGLLTDVGVAAPARVRATLRLRTRVLATASGRADRAGVVGLRLSAGRVAARVLRGRPAARVTLSVTLVSPAGRRSALVPRTFTLR